MPVGSTLGEQNQLFRAALRAERAGDRNAAKITLQKLLARYPESPLAVDARRVLERVSSEPE